MTQPWVWYLAMSWDLALQEFRFRKQAVKENEPSRRSGQKQECDQAVCPLHAVVPLGDSKERKLLLSACHLVGFII